VNEPAARNHSLKAILAVLAKPGFVKEICLPKALRNVNLKLHKKVLH